ncbi:MAG: arylesterase [Betaproteobacteria bacterium]
MSSFSHLRQFVSLALFSVLIAFTLTARGQTVPPSTARILVVGDSLSSEYGLTRGTGWVALLKKALTEARIESEILNASISGDTTSGGVTRLKRLLDKHTPGLVILELGGNDALRGLPLEMTRQNLNIMATQARESGAKVVIVGMQIPPNYGREYATGFREVFESVAKQNKASLVPFLLEGVAADPKYLQADNLHPNELAQPQMMRNVLEVVLALLKT